MSAGESLFYRLLLCPTRKGRAFVKCDRKTRMWGAFETSYPNDDSIRDRWVFICQAAIFERGISSENEQVLFFFFLVANSNFNFGQKKSTYPLRLIDSETSPRPQGKYLNDGTSRASRRSLARYNHQPSFFRIRHQLVV